MATMLGEAPKTQTEADPRCSTPLHSWVVPESFPDDEAQREPGLLNNICKM